VRRFALIWGLVAIAVLTAGGSSAFAQDPPPATAACTGADRVATDATVAQTRAALTCLINAARAERQIAPLRVETHLQTAAQRYARALDPAKPLTHSGRGGSSPLDRIADAGYGRGASGFSAAETLGRSQGALSAPAIRVTAWLASASTRKLLLSAKYRDVGIGVAGKGDATTFVVEVAARANTPPPTSGSK
jgi:uncharacterized protein YkwD